MLLADVRDDECHGSTVEEMMVGVSQDHVNFMRPRWQSYDDERLTAGVCPVPRSVVEDYVNMADPWCDVECIWAKNRFYTQVFRSILNENLAFS